MGKSSNFVGSESGHIQNVKVCSVLQYTVSNKNAYIYSVTGGEGVELQKMPLNTGVEYK